MASLKEIDQISTQIDFLKEADLLKSVFRQSPLLDQSRKENSAEHSWHLGLYALVLEKYAKSPVDLLRVIKMLLIHDLVEIDAGDSPIHAQIDVNQASREAAAAARLFGILPDRQAHELLGLWREFEDAKSNDSQFAKALDRFQPLLVNIGVGGGTWIENSVSYENVLERYGPVIERGAPRLWDHARELVSDHFLGKNRR